MSAPIVQDSPVSKLTIEESSFLHKNSRHEDFVNEHGFNSSVNKQGLGTRRRLIFTTAKLRRQYDPTNMARAFEATCNGLSVYRAAKTYGIPESTLRDRTRGNVELLCNPGPDRIFDEEEEKNLVVHIEYMSSIGYGYTKANIQYLGFDYAVSCKKKSRSDHSNESNMLSDSWFYGFMKRWPELKLVKPQKLSVLRAKNTSKDVIDNYYKELKSILELNNLMDKPHRIFNIDETGINTEHAPPKVVCNKNNKPQAITSPRSSTVTIIGGGSASGSYIPPYYVFPGKRWNKEFLEGASPGASGEMSPTGWSNSAVFESYIKNHFSKHANITCQDPALVLFDGHKSHISLTLEKWSRDNNVTFFVLPPHTSHMTQPLDVAVFGPFKSMYSRECQSYLQKNPGVNISKYEIASISGGPYLRAMSPANLVSAFRKTGIYPFSSNMIQTCELAPATIYEPAATEICKEVPKSKDDDEKENNPSPASFLKKRTITLAVPKPKKKRFIPPFLSGSLSKETNMSIMSSCAQKKTLLASKDTNMSCMSTSTQLKKTSESLKTVPKKTPSSPQAGPSAYYVDDSDHDSLCSDSSEDSEPCCVCNKNFPPTLRNQIIIVNWSQCDNCSHWTHLRYCSSVKFVRRHGSFLCPHCE